MFVEKLLSLIFNPPVGELVDIRLGWRPECVHYSHHLTPQHHLPSSQVLIHKEHVSRNKLQNVLLGQGSHYLVNPSY